MISLPEGLNPLKKQLLLPKVTLLNNLHNLLLIQTQQDVLQLQICMDQVTHPVQVVKTDQNLLRDGLADVHGDSLVVVALHDVKEVDTHDLEDHAEVVAVRASVDEGVKELDDTAIIAVELFCFLKGVRGGLGLKGYVCVVLF